MPAPGYIEVVNLEKYQHYKDRNPPWVKLHAATLRNYEFSCLPDASKAHLMLFWVIASQHENRIPADPEFIRAEMKARSPIDLQVLIDAGFIRRVQDDSTVLAPRTQHDAPETEGENREENNSAAPSSPGLSVVEGNPFLLALDRTPVPPPEPKPTRTPKPETPQPSWPAEASELLQAHIGLFKPGHCGGALAPLVRKHGWPHVRAALEAYCLIRPYRLPNGQYPKNPDETPEKNVAFCGPDDFAKQSAYWLDMTTRTAATVQETA